MRDVPLPEALARLFLEYRKEARFGKGNEFVFANSTGKKPFHPRNIYGRHLKAVADELGIPRNSLFKLERTTNLLTAQAGLTSAQQDTVLRLRRRSEVVQPTPADVDATRAALDRCIGFVLPTTLMDSLKPDRRDDTAEISPLAADREARLQAFIEKRCTITTVRDKAKVHKPDLQNWRKGKLPDSSVKAERIEAVLSGKFKI